MSKTAKWILLGTIFVVLGGLIFVFGMTALRWDFSRIDGVTYEEKHYTPPVEVAPTIQTVIIDVDSFPVVVQKGEALSLDYYEASDSEVQVECTRTEFIVREERDFSLRHLMSFGRYKRKYVLTLPAANIDLKIEGTNADITLADTSFSRLDMDVTNADITLDRCRFSVVNIRGTNLDMQMRSCEGDEAVVHGTNLDLEVRTSTINALTATGTNTDVEMTVTVSERVALKGTNADFTLEDCTLSTLSAEGTNLDADVYIIGKRSDYTIESHGKSLPQDATGSDLDKKLYFKGTNNDVDLRFSEN